MTTQTSRGSLILGVFLLLAFSSLGFLLGKGATAVKAFERSVTVKGLSEREYPADVVIWPIQFNEASNSLEDLYSQIESSTAAIRSFLLESGIGAEEISVSSPSITDKSAQRYGESGRAQFRYTAVQVVTVYSTNIDQVRSAMGELSSLGKKGIVFVGNEYQNQTEYLFTRLNEVKPEMIEEATKEARAVALKFAEDSNSRLGKIKRATQGQFSIYPRDRQNPQIKKVRVVSTVEYYLSD